jgi:3-methyladenine DNA glycosylase AlkC
MENSFSSVISPRSLLGSPKKFEFESQNAKDYVDTLEQNLSHHSELILQLLKSQNKDSLPVDEELAPALSMETLVENISKLIKQLKEVENERKVAVSKILINDLLEHEHSEKFSEVVSDFEEQLQEARFHIDRKDKLIYDLQKQNSELELQMSYKQTIDGCLIVPLQADILDMYEKVEEIRNFIDFLEEKVCFGINFKNHLISSYKKNWNKAQILQALLRNPVNVREGFGRVIRLSIENEEPDVTLEFEESDIEEPAHFRAYTLSNDSFESPSHKRNTLSSGKELIQAVRSKLVSKINSCERKIGLYAIDIQKCNETLNDISKENFELMRENSRIALVLKKMKVLNF